MNSDVRVGSSPILGTNINIFKFNNIMTKTNKFEKIITYWKQPNNTSIYFEILNSDSTQYTTEAQIATALENYGGQTICVATNAKADYTDPRVVYANGNVIEVEIASSDIDSEISFTYIHDTVTRIL